MMSSRLTLYAAPVLYALFVWWFSTGAIIYLNNLPRRTHRWSMVCATALLLLLLHRLHVVSHDTSLSGAYAAFTYGLLVWGWQEMSFFMGFVTGPVREPCPAECVGWPLFARAVRACLYHECASLAFGAVLVALAQGGTNHIATWTYFVLWALRMSAKLNVLLGVRNLSEEFIPEHLAFIRSFLRQGSMNLLFPVSVTAATVTAVVLAQQAAAPGASQFTVTGSTFLALLVALGVIEHWFLVLPLPAAALWNWSLPEAKQPRGRNNAGAARAGTGFAPALPQLSALSVRIGTNTPIGGSP